MVSVSEALGTRLLLQKKPYIVYCYSIFMAEGTVEMDKKNEKIREQIIVAMLEEFPTLKSRIKVYLEEDLKKRDLA